MTFPTRIRYALRLLAYLAIQEPGRRVPVSGIAVAENVSVKYLEQIVGALRPLKALRSLRGARGGYVLVKDPKDISISDIFECLGGMAYPVPCLENTANCCQVGSCATRPFWLKLDVHMRGFLQEMTLADIVADAPRAAIDRIAGNAGSIGSDEALLPRYEKASDSFPAACRVRKRT